jgi:thiosulfate/3-mercaptopyruvate sulfurtransferase
MKNLYRSLAAAALGLGLQCAALAGVLPGPVVSTDWLATHADQVQIVEVRSDVKSFTAAPEFETDAKSGKKTLEEVGGHIPGALLFNAKTMRTERNVDGRKVKYLIPERAEFERFVRSAGIRAGKPIVLVPTGTGAAELDDALRAYWQFKVYGEDDLAVLDGGTAAWLVEGRAFSTDAAPAAAGDWQAGPDRSARYLASSDDVAQAIAGRRATLVDGRDVRQFHGLSKRDYVGDYGHLEGAKVFPPDLLTTSAGGATRLMSAKTYAALLSAQGIDPQGAAITYCNSGHLAAGPWFVMSELLGNTQARLYDGSLHEWTLQGRPLAGAVPK